MPIRFRKSLIYFPPLLKHDGFLADILPAHDYAR